MRAAGRPSLAVVNSTVIAEGATAEALGDTPVEPVSNTTNAKLVEFRAWGAAEKEQWGTYPPMQRAKDERPYVRKWAVENGVDRQAAEAWARKLGWARKRGRPK